MSLTARTVSGVKWSVSSEVARQALRTITVLVLVGLIGPAEFGLVSMSLVVIGFVELFRDLGTTAAVIHRKEATQRLLSTVFWTNVAIGIVGGLVVFAGAPLAAAFYDEERVTPLLQLLSLAFVISGFAVVQKALLAKQLRFRAMAHLEVGGTVVGSAVALTAALSGMGAYSLVLQTLTLSAVMTVGAWVVSTWRPTRVFALDDLRSVWGYSSSIVGFNVVNYFARNADNALIGRYLGATELGYYALAYNVLLFPLQMVSRSIARVTFPAYSLLQDDPARIARAYLRVAGVVATIAFPIVCGIFVIAEPTVDLLYGEDWASAKAVIMILVPVGLAQSLGTLNGSIFQAVGRADLQFWTGLVSSALMVASFVVGLQWGIVGVAAAYAVTSSVIIVYPAFAVPLKLVGLRLRDLAAAVWRPLAGAVGMGAIVWGARVLEPWLETELAGIAVLIVVGVVSYVALSSVINRAEIVFMRALLRGGAPGGAGGRAAGRA